MHVSHRAAETLRLADRIAVLTDGTIRQLGEPPAVVQQPADGTVARLLGYENVLEVQVDASGRVLIDGAPCGLVASLDVGPATLAAWGSAIRVGPPDAAPLRATVERVSQGPGRWDVILAAAHALHAHLPLDQTPPRANDSVGVQVDSAHASLIAEPPTTRPRSRE